MERNSSECVCVVADFKYLYKNFGRFYNQLREIGKFKGDIVVITRFKIFKIFIKHLNKKNSVYLLTFKKIKFDKAAEDILANLNSYPNRHLTKNFQWHKLYLFHNSLKKWDRVFYLDINMTIHDNINPILNIKPNNQIFARCDGYPDYKWKLNSQFDQKHKLFNSLNNSFDLETNKYFQTGVLYFDTKLIDHKMLDNLINLVNKYPISITNEQGILNIYFLFIEPKFEELVEFIDDKLSYFYWYESEKKPIITKALTRKNK